jgi:large subunit ribosomal protein L8e
VNNVEERPGDRGCFSRSTGAYATIIGHSEDGVKTRVRLPSGARKTLSGECRATIGVIAGGGR